VRPLVIWDHTVLPAIRQSGFSRLCPSICRYSFIDSGRMKGWVDLGGWYTKMVYLQMVTHPSINRARRRVTTLIETNALPLPHHLNFRIPHIPHILRMTACSPFWLWIYSGWAAYSVVDWLSLMQTWMSVTRRRCVVALSTLSASTHTAAVDVSAYSPASVRHVSYLLTYRSASIACHTSSTSASRPVENVGTILDGDCGN